ncbi:MAG: ABC transporter permease [Romboutsia sp.]|nr:ABC transporter permease [Romboutsia sp.]
MALLILIKKEIMQFFRSKTNVLTMFLFPIALIVIMGISLNGLMNVDKSIFNNKKIYYKVDNLENSEKYLRLFYTFKNSCEESVKVTFEKVEDDNKAREFVNKGDALAFINIKKDSYDYYMSETKDISDQRIFKNVFENYLNRYSLIESVELGTIKEIINKESLIKLKEEGISNNGVDSFTYYTFSILILIILYISGITSISMYNESFQGTLVRVKMSRVNNLTVILSKIILGIIIGILQIMVIYIMSTVFLNINWGDNLLQMFIVLISFIIFASVLGVSMSMIFDEVKTTNSVINIVIIILGFLGGLYMPISLIKSINITNKLSQLTPTYWANISLLSLSSGLSSKYTYKSILLSLGLSIILITVGLIIRKMKVGDKLA